MVVLCENHDPPLCFSIADSLRQDAQDDACPACGRDDALEHVLTDLTPESYAGEYGLTLWSSQGKVKAKAKK